MPVSLAAAHFPAYTGLAIRILSTVKPSQCMAKHDFSVLANNIATLASGATEPLLQGIGRYAHRSSHDDGRVATVRFGHTEQVMQNF